MQVSFRQASGKKLTLSLREARDIISNPPKCPYCFLPIPWEELSVDHKIPRTRGGSDDRDNLVWCDLDCNMIKGSLLDTEFMELLVFLKERPTVYEMLKTRLKASGFLYKLGTKKKA